MPLLPSVKIKQHNDDTEDYRPPVPPHRNIGVSTAQNAILEDSPRRHHHHRHYHNNVKDNNVKKRESKPDYIKNDNDVIDNMNSCQPMKNIFEFDDEPCTPTNTPINGIKLQQQNTDRERDDDVEFVEFPATQNNETCNIFLIKLF